MSDFPEHDKMAAIAGQSQAIGEFLDWLGSQGIRQMKWREDLTDERLTDPECNPRGTGPLGRDVPDHKPECAPVRPVEDPVTAADLYVNGVWYQRQHCTHWTGEDKDCCRCGNGRHYTVTGIRSWVEDGRTTTALLAEFFEIDLSKIEAEKRAMLDAVRASAETAPDMTITLANPEDER
ncbi:MAG TPA: hypothetical protein VFQ44_02365 [Streptosporangiaceae bacterium]|nr:hypothetical protein [Streptosporangiaceae bacterium]